MTADTPIAVDVNYRAGSSIPRRLLRAILLIVAVACLVPFVAMYRQYTINAYYEDRVPFRTIFYRDPLPNTASIRGQLQYWGLESLDEVLSMSGKPYFLYSVDGEVDRQTSKTIVAWSRDWETLSVERAYSQWTDENTNDLQPLHKLTILGLDDTAITGKSMDVISRLTQLENLGIRGTAIRDEDLAQLRTLTRLKKLGISRTQITGAKLKDVAALPNLEFLTVARCEHFIIAPTVFEPFRGHPHLKKLCIDARFSDQDVAAIKKILPNVEMWVVPVVEPQEIYPLSAPEGTNSPGF